METVSLEVGERPRVRVPSVGGDLRVVGRAGSSLEAQAPSRDALTVTRESDVTVVTARLGCLLFVPEGTALEIGTVGGGARVSGLMGAASLATVSGDVNLRAMGTVSLGRCAGDVRITRARGTVTAEWVGGDARLENLQGDVHVELVEGALSLKQVAGATRARVRGEIDAELAPPPGSESSLQAEGDLNCRLPPDASVLVHYHAEGEVRVGLPSRECATPNEGTAQVGAGEARLDLDCKGDLRVGLIGGASRWNEEWKQDLEARIEAEVDAALAAADWQQELGGLSATLREDIAERIHSSLGRARRRAARAEAGMPRDIRIHVGGPASAGTSVGEDERLEILRMVERGTLTVEQAEQLFRAMEGGA